MLLRSHAQGVPKNFALSVWLLWRCYNFDCLSFTQLHRSGANFKFETLCESSDSKFSDKWLQIMAEEIYLKF